MTKNEAEKILTYVAKNIISPLAFDETPAREVWLRLSGDDFSKLCKFVHGMVETKTRKFFDIEIREIITEDVLSDTLEELKECDPDTYGDITLGQYINNCLTINNGTLEEV